MVVTIFSGNSGLDSNHQSGDTQIINNLFCGQIEVRLTGLGFINDMWDHEIAYIEFLQDHIAILNRTYLKPEILKHLNCINHEQTKRRN